jgi:signal transduction histidine kinase
VSSVSRLIVTTASMHTTQTQLFLLAAVVAIAFAGLMTWLWSRPIARAAVAPLARLRARVAAIDVDTGATADLGPIEDVSEVDELRATIGQLIERLARALDQAQRFAANAAHELRTPLTAVRAELELLAEKPQASPDVADGLTTARTKVTDLALLVEKLLILATPKGAVDAPAEVLSLRDMMEDVVQGLPPEQSRKVTLSDEDALVRGDTVLLTTMFTNGLVNALKFGNEVRVNLKARHGRVVITIDDDGPGLDEANLERVFEPFFRSQQALQRRVPGHGLGLALVRHVAENHGGSAHFGHKETVGARLHIELPQIDG